jgi:hypothetical protein
MKQFTVLSGESYSVMADSEDEALEKFFAYNDGENCERHDYEECECIQTRETLTVVI